MLMSIGPSTWNTRVGVVRIVVSGGDSYVQVQLDHDLAPEMTIKVEGVTGLTRADFIL